MSLRTDLKCPVQAKLAILCNEEGLSDVLEAFGWLLQFEFKGQTSGESIKYGQIGVMLAALGALSHPSACNEVITVQESAVLEAYRRMQTQRAVDLTKPASPAP